MQIIDRPTRLLSLVSQMSAKVAYIAISLLLLLVLAEILVRTFFNFSLNITLVISSWLLVSITFMGLAWTLKVGGHIRIELISSHLPQQVQRWVMLCIATVAMVSIGFISISAWHELVNQYQLHTVSNSTPRLPMWWAWIPFCIGLSIFTLQFIGLVLESISSLRQSRGQK